MKLPKIHIKNKNDLYLNDLIEDTELNPNDLISKDLQKTTQKFFRSETMKNFIDQHLSKIKIDGLENVTMYDIVQEIVTRKDKEGKNHKCFVFGGLVRDFVR